MILSWNSQVVRKQKSEREIYHTIIENNEEHGKRYQVIDAM